MTIAGGMATGGAALLSVARFNAMVAEGLPLAHHLGIRAERLSFGEATLLLPASAHAIRPGGTVGGPALMTLADAAMWAAVLAATGDDPRPLTTNLTIDFLRRPRPGDIVAQARLLGFTGSLAVGLVRMTPASGGEPVAQASCTYALP